MKRIDHSSARGIVVLLVGAMVCGMAGRAAALPLITGVAETGTNLDPVGAWFTGQTFTHPNEGVIAVPFLGEDVPSFSDRAHEYNGITPALSLSNIGLAGAEYVMIANDNKQIADYRLTVTVSATVDMYVFMDTRVSPQPAWLTNLGFIDTHLDIGVDEGGDGVGPGQAINNVSNIWLKTNVPAGSITLFENDPSTGSRNMYGVAVVEPGDGPQLTPADPPVPFQIGNFALIDIGATDGRGEFGAAFSTGGMQQIGAGPHNTNAVNLAPTSLISAGGHEFVIAIDNFDETGAPVGALDWRDRGDGYTGDAPFFQPLVRLGEDLVKNNLGIINVTLDNLPAGAYQVTSFHDDPEFSQSELIRVFVNNGLGFFDTGVTASAATSDGVNPGGTGEDRLSTAAMLGHSAQFVIISDGVSPVRILFDGRSAVDTELPLNGLNISRLSEPGDVNQDGVIDAADIDTMFENLGSFNPIFDLDASGGPADVLDATFLIRNILGTQFGDANLDLKVNITDLSIVATNFGRDDTGWARGNFNGMNGTNITDLSTVALFFGTDLTGGGGGRAIPEPATATLLALLCGGAAGRRRRRGA